jgi:endoglucanase
MRHAWHLNMKMPRVALLAAVLSLAPLLPAQTAPAVRLNTVGYLPPAPKHASVLGATGQFTVVRATDGAIVFTGDLTPARPDADTKADIADADFTAVTAPGEYRLRTTNGGESAVFRIDAQVFAVPYQLVTRAMYLWRCGVAVDGDRQGSHFHHDACHLQDAWMDHVNGKHERVASTGGWHDAGDYNKYVVNAGVTVGAMLRAWEDFPAIRGVGLSIPESGGRLPDFLAEVKFETDWLLTMQAADGQVYTKVSTERFGAFVLPEKEETPRYFCPAGTPAAADFVAMLAQAARAFAPYEPDYAARCLAAARKTQAYLASHPEEQAPNQSAFRTGGYPTHDPDDRLWAVAELWQTTGEADLLHEVESRIRSLAPEFNEDFDWGDVKNLGLLTYLFSDRAGRDEQLVRTVGQNLVTVADTIVAKAQASGYARPLGSRYYWGGNGGVARQTLLLQAAHRLTKSAKYRDTALDAINHLFGRNVDGRSYVTGLGANPPLHPHDRRSGGDQVEAPWPGYLVGGPHPGPADWKDIQPDARTNEIAINWNAALIYALAGFVEKPATP